MLPTDLILLRRVIATFGDQYHQEIELTLPIFYDSGYLNLNEHDKAELVRLNQEFKGLMAEYESFTSRFSDFMNRYNELHKRGRPPGVIRDSELLVPYSGMPNDKIGNLGPIRVIKQQTESIEPRAATAPVSPITVEPKK